MSQAGTSSELPNRRRWRGYDILGSSTRRTINSNDLEALPESMMMIMNVIGRPSSSPVAAALTVEFEGV